MELLLEISERFSSLTCWSFASSSSELVVVGAGASVSQVVSFIFSRVVCINGVLCSRWVVIA